ncbi:MAG: hypothetical protein K9G58_12105 [Bacteroidales bacterium]|nr:hypothetical protein [Bacteroidales bacterium]MCF8387472.1 hypothetical protein [Bacteroidales bacterium]MCF8398908.1 hypothetical protein [Bacteroidales bacterium]
MLEGNEEYGIPGQHPDLDLDELRELLTGMESRELEKVRRWLHDVDAFAEDISTVIPLSIKQLVEKRIILPETLLPIVEEAIESSVLKNPHKLADALFPIMGPAIRKAVSEDLKKMIQSLNTALENSFSPKRLSWRLQAAFSRRTYSDIVLSHILVYRVRQVFLIHRRTGILLQHEIDESVSHKDPDMVGAMLTAINDFVRDSFDVKKDQEIQTVQVGEFTVWVEQGPHAILAGIVEGNPPAELRELFQQALENIHLDFRRALVHFDGDTEVFDKDHSHIESCLKKQSRTKKKKPVIVIIIFAILFVLLGYWLFLYIDEEIRWNSYLDKVKQMQGVVITNEGKKEGMRTIVGMRDPLAKNPDKFTADYGFEAGDINSNWQYYYSLQPAFIIKRAILKLNPPKAVKLSYENGVLFLKGKSKEAWLDQARASYYEILGVDKLNADSLEITGGVNYQSYKKNIDQFVFNYEYGITDLDAVKMQKLEKLRDIIREMLEKGADYHDFTVQLIGYTLSAGNVESNKEFILRRANIIRDYLIDMGIRPELISTDVRLYEDEASSELSPRSVSIDMQINVEEK